MLVTLHQYKKDLPMLFVKEKEKILNSIPSINDIHHIGSSAVPGLGGKNIIDILIGLTEYKDLEKLTNDFKKLGYITKWIDYKKEWTYLSSRDNTIEGDFHIHILRKGNDDYNYYLIFRDYLIAHNDEKETYSKLKQIWLRESKGIPRVYAELKTEYIKSVLLKATGGKAKIIPQNLPVS